MGKIKSFFGEQRNIVKDIFVRYSVTLISTVLLCIYEVLLSNEVTKSEIPVYFLVFLLFGGFFIESLFCGAKERISKKSIYVLYLCDAILSVIFTFIADNLENISNDRVLEKVSEGLCFYLCVLFLTGIYYLCHDFSTELAKKEGTEVARLGLHRYLTGVVFELIKLFLIFMTINIGVMALLAMFDTLIAEIDYWDWMDDVEIMLTGLVYVPYALTCFTNVKKETSKFVKGFLKFVLMPMVIIAMLIIYLYIFKIVFGGEFPSNEIFGICAWLFTLGAPIWTMTVSVLDSEGNAGIYYKLVKYAKYVYAPFIILEIYTIRERISQYGLTEERYLAIVFIVLQLIYIFWEQIRRLFAGKKAKPQYGDKYEALIYVVLFAMLVVMFAPFININYLPSATQIKRFDKAYERINELGGIPDIDDANEIRNGTYSDEYIEQAYIMEGAYNYLRYTGLGREYLEERFTKKQIADIMRRVDVLSYMYGDNSDDRDYYNDTDISLYLKAKDCEFDISGYDRMYEIDYRSYDAQKLSSADFGMIFLVYGQDDSEQLIVDMSGELAELIKSKVENYYSYDSEETVNEPIVIEQPGEYRLIVNNLSMKYDIQDQKISQIYMKGWLLKK